MDTSSDCHPASSLSPIWRFNCQKCEGDQERHGQIVWRLQAWKNIFKGTRTAGRSSRPAKSLLVLYFAIYLYKIYKLFTAVRTAVLQTLLFAYNWFSSLESSQTYWGIGGSNSIDIPEQNINLLNRSIWFGFKSFAKMKAQKWRPGCSFCIYM